MVFACGLLRVCRLLSSCKHTDCSTPKKRTEGIQPVGWWLLPSRRTSLDSIFRGMGHHPTDRCQKRATSQILTHSDFGQSRGGRRVFSRSATGLDNFSNPSNKRTIRMIGYRSLLLDPCTPGSLQLSDIAARCLPHSLVDRTLFELHGERHCGGGSGWLLRRASPTRERAKPAEEMRVRIARRLRRSAQYLVVHL